MSHRIYGGYADMGLVNACVVAVEEGAEGDAEVLKGF